MNDLKMIKPLSLALFFSIIFVQDKFFASDKKKLSLQMVINNSGKV
jgi:hypothetical protein